MHPKAFNSTIGSKPSIVNDEAPSCTTEPTIKMIALFSESVAAKEVRQTMKDMTGVTTTYHSARSVLTDDKCVTEEKSLIEEEK